MRIFVTGTRGIPNIMGGVETHVEELFPRIAKKGAEVTVVRRSSYVHDTFTEWQGVRLLNVETPKKKSFEAIVHTYRAVLVAKKNKADILHVNAIGPALVIPFAKLLGLNVVFTHHGFDYDRDKWGFAAKTMLKLGERMGCKFADHVIVISQGIKDVIAQKYGRIKNVHLIYNGFSEPEFCEYQEYFDELGIEKGHYILAACRFVPEKNLHHLIEAYVKFCNVTKSIDTPSNIRLVIAGDTDFEDEYSHSLKALAKEHNVVLTGFVKGKKLHSLLTNAKCYVLPSSHEGLPIALLEAMSYKLPVIVSDIPANKEIGLPSSDYFSCGNVDELAEKIGEVCLKSTQRIEYNMNNYNWDVIADQTYKVYESIINEKQ